MSETQFSSLDCLALGYLSLMTVPELPQPWLARTLKSKFPALWRWTEETREMMFCESVAVNEELENGGRRNTSSLPWRTTSHGGVIDVAELFISSIADSIPIIGQLRRNTRMRQHGGKTSDHSAETSSWMRLVTFASVLSGAGLLIGYVLQQGLLLPSSEDKKRTGNLEHFGEAGEALAAYARQLDFEIQGQREVAGGPHVEPVMEVDIEVDDGFVRGRDSVVLNISGM